MGMAVMVMACTAPAPDPRTDDVPTRGQVLVIADEDLRPVMDGLHLAFTNTYREARIELRYTPGSAALKELMNDSVRVVFMATAPGADQQAYFRTRNLYPELVPLFTDGIAIVQAPGGPAVVSVEEIRARLAGERPGAVLFAGSASGLYLTLVDSLFAGDAGKIANAAAVENVDSLVRRVANDTTALGVLSFAQISDLDHPQARVRRAGVDLCAVSHENSSPAVPLNQSTLADGSYPLRRTIYALVTEGKTGLGTGFVSYIAGHKGQRAILKSGLAPMQVPAREVEIVH